MFTNGRTERFHSTQTNFGGAFYDLKKKKKKRKGRGPPLQGFICFPSRFMLERTGKQVDIAISHSAQGFNRSSLKSQHPHHPMMIPHC